MVPALPLRRFLPLWSLVALLGAAPATPRGEAAAPREIPPPPARTWKHPAEYYPQSVRRWFEALPPQLQYSEMRFRRGDDLRWTQPDWNDADWEVRPPLQLPARTGVKWLRFRVRMGADGRGAIPPGIMITTVMAYDLYWDGVLLGSSGRPAATREKEMVGWVDQWFSIPTALCGPGEHSVAVRASSYRVGFPTEKTGLRFLVDSPGVLQGKALREAFVPTLACGALFMIGLASLIMWALAARRATLMLLGGLCFAGATMQALQAFRWFLQYPADWHHPVYTAMLGLVGLQGLLTVAFETEHFAVPRGRWLLAGVGLALASAGWLSPDRTAGVLLLAIGLGAALAFGTWALWQRRRGAWPVVIGVAASGLLLAVEAEDFRASFFLKFFPALLGLISSLALQLHDERRRAHAAQLASARLELELLKKNLQPHFLLNTLTALSEIVEQDPRAAGQLIDDLAAEFRTVARVSAEKLIPLAQELDLCRAHLRVMSVRTGRAWNLEATGVDEAALVPPAILLTLIENGFAHQRVAGPAAAFSLRTERTGGAFRLTFLSPGEIEVDATRPAGGTGLRYVQARLEESFPGRWSLQAGAEAGGWQTTIKIAGGPEGPGP